MRRVRLAFPSTVPGSWITCRACCACPPYFKSQVLSCSLAVIKPSRERYDSSESACFLMALPHAPAMADVAASCGSKFHDVKSKAWGLKHCCENEQAIRQTSKTNGRRNQRFHTPSSCAVSQPNVKANC